MPIVGGVKIEHPEDQECWWTITRCNGRSIGFTDFETEAEAEKYKQEIIDLYSESWDVVVVFGSYLALHQEEL